MWNEYSNKLFDAMISRSNKTPLEKTSHFLELSKLISYCEPINSIVDIGCGVADLGRIYNNKKYLGLDLSNIINNVSKLKNPDLNYVYFNANSEQIPVEIKEYDMIVMNSFLSELSNPINFLEKLFVYNNKYIIIHRQDFTDTDTFTREYSSYANLKSTNSYINFKEFQNCAKNFNYDVKLKISLNLEKKESVLLTRF